MSSVYQKQNNNTIKEHMNGAYIQGTKSSIQLSFTLSCPIEIREHK